MTASGSTAGQDDGVRFYDRRRSPATSIGCNGVGCEEVVAVLCGGPRPLLAARCLLGIYIALGKIELVPRVWWWGGGPENGNFPLLYVVKISLCRGVGGSKKPQNTLT